jgi:hypothetical protein
MTSLKFAALVALLSSAISAPSFAGSHYHAKHRHYQQPWTDSIWWTGYTHNYGPGRLPGQPFSYYDGSLSDYCGQSAAAYLGQDGRRHPC